MDHQKALKEMHDAFYNFPWENGEMYREYLAQSYFYINHSTRLLAAAAAHTSDDERVLFKRYAKHIGEEMSHEILCINDLKALGAELSDFSEFPITNAFYTTQYRRIETVGPASFMGYVFALETAACLVGPRILEDKVARLYDRKAISFLKVHAEEDVSHIEKAQRMINELPESAQKQVQENIVYTAELFVEMLSAIVRKHKVSTTTITKDSVTIINEAFEAS